MRRAAFFDVANDTLGFDLAKLCMQGPVDQLNLTENMQPPTLTDSLAMLQPLERRGLSATAAAGHSLGEYTAITAAGGFTMKDAVSLVRKRGRYMQEAILTGTEFMAAILGMECSAAVEKTVIPK
jgi:[acyl-carrier-protein] S-malonyltransferase